VSEYQYYEFQALDRPLSDSERNFLQSLSSRVQLTPTSATYIYNYGDFRGDPMQVLERCFDAMLYVANWGTRQLAFRLPASIIDFSALEPYCFPDIISTLVTPEYVILDISIIDETIAGWIDGEGWLPALTSLRQDLLRGDFRALYLAWLKAAQIGFYEEAEDDDPLEPPVPANLQNRSDSLNTLIELFEIDEDLITVAAEASVAQEEQTDSLESWIPELPEAERNHFLRQMVRGEPHVEMKLRTRLQELFPTPQNAEASSDTPRRRLSELQALAQNLEKQRQEREQREVEAARCKHLEALGRREAAVWEEIQRLIDKKQAKAYDTAVTYLVDLRDLAALRGQLASFQSRIDRIQDDYSNRPGLLSRLRRMGLLSD
jgi:hypothetical protein